MHKLAAPAKPTKHSRAESNTPVGHASHFCIVGLGASAGGLEAFEQFFRSMPAVSGIAFVLVSHLDPEHVSLLTEILQRSTTIPLIEAQDQAKVEPDHVYVIPPNRDMTIFDGILHVSMPQQPRGQRMPIDSFFRSLAEDQGEHSVGIILSGTGTDGTLGLREIIGAGGVALVQEPASAKYDGMPNSAIQGGFATHVLRVEKMPDALFSHLNLLSRNLKTPPETISASDINRILLSVRNKTGHDFSLYKKSTIGRRIERRMLQHNIEDTASYVRYLAEHPEEVQSLFKEMLINVTCFFRDPEAFASLKDVILPALLADKLENYVFRVWVAGCSTGEEAYSIAILLTEYMDKTGKVFKIQLYATDLDDDAIAIARAGLYPENIAQDVTPERLRHYFNKEETNYRVKKNIREMVVFAIQNVIKDPPFTSLDLVTCRNLMIYLESELQNRLIPTFHYALKVGGVLFLSPSEGISKHTDLFSTLDRKWKFYRALQSTNRTRALMTSGQPWSIDRRDKTPEEVLKRATKPNFAELTQRTLLQLYAPASVLTDLQGNILFVYGETGKYLRPAPGQATLNVTEMAHEGLQLEIRAALNCVVNQLLPTLNHEVLVKSNGDFQNVSLSVRPLSDPDANEGLLLLSFQHVAPPLANKPDSRKRSNKLLQTHQVEELERDLAYTKKNLQATIEEQQASNEELKSANEEMQSTNEELQSTNEELETSKEELQSVNEELITVNSELQAKIEQLSGMQNDMKNLLDNINVGTIFLDQHLAIRRFTREAKRVYRLVDADIGRFLADIRSNMDGSDLLAEAQTVLTTLASYESQVHIHDGSSYLARIQPYRTLDNVIEGVVLSFTDITQRVEAEAAVQAVTAVQDARALAEAIVDTVREPLLVLDEGFKIVSASRSFYKYFKVTTDDTIGRSVYELGNCQWDIPALHELLETLLPRDQSFEDYAVTHNFPVIGERTLLLNARRLVGRLHNTALILLAMDIPPKEKPHELKRKRGSAHTE